MHTFKNKKILHQFFILISSLVLVINVNAGNYSKMTLVENNSKYYADKIERLTTMALPDEWLNNTDTATVSERFLQVAMLKAQIKNPHDPKVSAFFKVLIEKYHNEGKPFQFIIYFNRPMSINDNEAAYILYVISLVNNAFVVIKGITHKGVMNKNKTYTNEQLLILEKIFS